MPHGVLQKPPVLLRVWRVPGHDAVAVLSGLEPSAVDRGREPQPLAANEREQYEELRRRLLRLVDLKSGFAVAQLQRRAALGFRSRDCDETRRLPAFRHVPNRKDAASLPGCPERASTRRRRSPRRFP